MNDRSTTRWLLAGGVIEPVFFFVVFLIEGWTRAGYDSMRMFVSLLSRWAAYSVASGVGMLVAFLGMFAFEDVTGLLQRIAIVSGFSWVAQISWRLRREVIDHMERPSSVRLHRNAARIG